MKFIKRFFLFLVILLIILTIGGYFYVKSTAPTYSGEIVIEGIKEDVKVTFDELGIPHIEARNAEDAYLALGYIHAQDRLFQMEMIRRLVSGRLSEFIGEKALASDKYLLTLSMWKKSKEVYEKQFKNVDTEFTRLCQSYTDGINKFMEEGNLPIEYKILGIPLEPFTGADMFATMSFMSLGFTSAITQEPLLTKMYTDLGVEYTKLFEVDSLSNNALYQNIQNEDLVNVLSPFEDFVEANEMPIWYGSNNWVISKERSESGKVLLGNDTHIKHSQPAVWYEAYMKYPGFEIYGYYLAGIPFPVVGHTRDHGWGLTIFPIDNMDLYQEKLNPENENEVLYNGKYQPMTIDNYAIKVKGGEDVNFVVKSTVHGPILNDVVDVVKDHHKEPISMFWSLLDLDMTSIKSMYDMTYAKSMDEFRTAAANNDIIGLNIVYGDTKDNIALWSSGRILRRDSSINSKLILDGTTSKDEHNGYYPFELNPAIVNPKEGYIHTANSEPIRVNGILYPGYYVPGLRNKRIHKLLEAKKKWNLKDMAALQNDDKSDRDPALMNYIIDNLDENIIGKDKLYSEIVQSMKSWDGQYGIDDVEPTIFNSVIYFTLKEIMEDELGSADFERMVSIYLVRGKMDTLIRNPHSIWYDNINTKNIKETPSDVLTTGFVNAVNMLKSKNGENINTWKWGNTHTVTYKHPMGKVKLLNDIFGFNVGPFPIEGGNEVINKQGHKYNKEGDASVTDGPALRMLIDFADVANSQSCIPSGQSGNVMSPHYNDQAQMYINGIFHTQYMNVEEIKNGSILTFKSE